MKVFLEVQEQLWWIRHIFWDMVSFHKLSLIFGIDPKVWKKFLLISPEVCLIYVISKIFFEQFFYLSLLIYLYKEIFYKGKWSIHLLIFKFSFHTKKIFRLIYALSFVNCAATAAIYLLDFLKVSFTVCGLYLNLFHISCI